MTIDYTDKHLNSPLAVYILAKLIDQLRTKFHFEICSVTLHLGNTTDNNDYGNNEIVRFFPDRSSQASFIYKCFNSMGIISPNIDRQKITQHERDILISDGSRELSILPNGGISWGWRLHNSAIDFNTKNDLLDTTKSALLYNYAIDGIVYTVVLSD